MYIISSECLFSNSFVFACLILVNAISWASPDYGLMLACGSSDGSISIISSSGECLVFVFRKKTTFVTTELLQVTRVISLYRKLLFYTCTCRKKLKVFNM